MKIFYSLIFFVFLSMVMTVHVFGDMEVMEVMAEGISDIKDTAMARDEALNHAQRMAVEKGVGVYVDSNTLVKNYQLIDDNVITESQGYLLPDYQILSEGREPDGFYHVALSARVRMGKISGDIEILERIHKIGLIKKGGNPRIMIVMTKDDLGKRISSNFAVSKLSGVLINQGFDVISESVFKHNLEMSRKKELMNGNISTAASIGTENGCEIVVVGHVITNKGEPIKIGAVTARPVNANLEIRCIQADNSRVIFSKTVRSGGSNSEADAITRVCKNVGKYLSGGILDSVVSNINKIQIQIKEMGYEDFEQFTLDLVKVRGVLNRFVRHYDGQGRSIVDVEATEQSWQIMQKFKTVSSLNLTIESVSRSKIVLKKEI
ncbi:MAG: hypothetical protein GY941_03395 [Planctomycetes bacterium]|nr:hypothetical protein [Planctomycetota bacterium]